jgi:23S rRNA pseudouridine1911/1915/1917 synthase
MSSVGSDPKSPKIIFEDESLLVLDKPAGMVVDKSETQESGTVEEWLLHARKASLGRLERQGIVHRLDKDTSGLLLVAKTPEALENLQAQFKERIVKKEYLALVHGTIEKPRLVEGNIGRNPGNREKFIVLEEGKEASTEYEPIKLLVMSSESVNKIFEGFSKIQLKKLRTTNYELFTFLVARPKTGRTHQIRVHLKYIGFPIVSD